MKKIVILGAKGRFGRAATKAFSDAGWQVDAVARSWDDEVPAGSARRIIADGLDMASVQAACRGHKFIVNAFNPPYPSWERELPILTRNVINAAQAQQATVLIPGNVYNYGSHLPSVVTERTPQIANTKKGKLRIDMEQAYRDAQGYGVRTIILRGGDFFEGRATGNWFENYIANKIDRGVLTYPGAIDVDHAWAYLPDFARAMVALAERADQLKSFDEFGFEGFTMSGQKIADLASVALATPIKIRKFPWAMMRVVSLFSPLVREVMELQYLWNRPHRIDGNKFYDRVAEFKATPVEEVFKTMFVEDGKGLAPKDVGSRSVRHRDMQSA